MPSEQKKQWIWENTYVVGADDDQPDKYDGIETMSKFAGARYRIVEEKGPKAPCLKWTPTYGNPYNNKEASKAWKNKLLEAIARIPLDRQIELDECVKLPLDKRNELNEMLVKLKAQCEDDKTSCQDINWEERFELEKWLRHVGKWEEADFISEETLFSCFDMQEYRQYSDVPKIVTEYGSWALFY